MNPNERLKLQEMIKENNVEDNTNQIRELQHSQLIYNDVKSYLELKKKYPGSSNKEFYKKACITKCHFLFSNYTDIFNKLTKDELNLDILFKFIEVLREIEEEKCDQHEGSFKVGKILKELYIDTALRKEEKINKQERINKRQKKSKGPNTGKKISYADYKNKIDN